MPAKNILIVEDDENLVMIYCQVLKKAGYDVVIATDGVQAMNLARQAKPDLIISDFMFPAGGGESFHKRMRMSTFTMATPIVIISSVPRDEIERAVPFDSLTYYLGKPHNQAELLKLLGQILTPEGNSAAA